MQLRHFALLALPTAIHAVSLADMTPRATGLPQMCNDVYTSQIYGCSASDFQTGQCTSICISALYGLSQAIEHACGSDGLTGENLIVAFLAGVGPQQLCHNAGSNSGPGPGEESMTAPPMSAHPHPTFHRPSIIPSTTTARKPTDTSSLLVDTSSTMTETMIPHRTHKTQPTMDTSSSPQSSSILLSSTSPSPTQVHHTTSKLAVDTSRTPSPNPTTQTTSSAASSQTDLNDHSGGGSPFDTPGNVVSSASGVSCSLVSILLSAAAAIIAATRLL